jgi:hypothetical protein
MGHGCSVGSLKYHAEKGCLYNSLRLQEANFSFPLFFSFLLDGLSFHCIPIFQPHLTIRAKYLLTNGSSTDTCNLKESTKMKKEYIKPFVWGMVVGSVVLLIAIFSAGWVVTNGSAQAKAEEMATNAVIDRLAPISVAQFMQDPNREERLEELKELDSWKRSEYVEKQGWATMPGEKEADSKVARECARRLVELEK